MRIFTREELRTLVESSQPPCVSVYLPTHRVPTENQQDRTRLKNLLRQAQESLQAYGLRLAEAEALLEPATRLLGAIPFWKDKRDGLALFITPGTFRQYQLPTSFEPLVVVAHRFHIKPLLAFLGGKEFFVLALSQNAVKLFEGSPFGLSAIDDLEGVPKSLADALKYDELIKQLQFRTGIGTGGARGERAAMFHGQSADDAKDRIQRYFRQIDQGLRDLLREAQSPLVLAGVEYLLPIYKEVNTYQHLLNGGITGNPEGVSLEELHRQAWAQVEPYFKREQEEAAARYRELAGTGRTSHDPGEIVPGAYHGRVECLFVAVARQQWGDYDPGTNRVDLHVTPQPGSFDLLDLAATQTLLNGGAVYAVEPSEMPDKTLLAAVFRY
ncbi:MAG: baeRF3 domain-containing protein [Desulfobaccales bacterium]